jgi:hypothetical protein
MALTLPAALFAIAVLAAPANAASTRAEYVAQVDPICQKAHVAGKRETGRFKRQVRRLVHHGLDPDHPTKAARRASVRFADRVARDRHGALGQIAVIAPAPGDETVAAEWLRLKGQEINHFRQAYHAFARNLKPHQFRRLMGKSNTAGIHAFSLVADWGFQYCA